MAACVFKAQAAEVLLMMRPEGEASSDFQDYTLVALFALAAHLAPRLKARALALSIVAEGRACARAGGSCGDQGRARAKQCARRLQAALRAAALLRLLPASRISASP